jgi:hypothetical protein
LPIGAAYLTGLNHPMRRYALGLSNEPLFFSALMGFASLTGFFDLHGGFADKGTIGLESSSDQAIFVDWHL